MTTETTGRYEPTPIWMAALMASRCLANRRGEDSAVCWNHVSGKAVGAWQEWASNARMDRPLLGTGLGTPRRGRKFKSSSVCVDAC
ncbi:MAG: hypothetical protein ACLQU1_02200, partial [Bryobacteraceae bacterium]